MIRRIFKNDYFWVGILMLGLTGAMTFPLIFKFNSSIAGFASTDEPYGSIWYWWWLKFSLLNHLNPLQSYFLAAPEGMSIPFSIYPLWTAFSLLVSLLTNEIFTYNFEVFLSFILAGIFMYQLMFRITKNKLTSVFSALIYSFSPYHFARAWQHLGLAQIQFLPLYLFSLLLLKERPTLKRIILAGLGLLLVSSFDFYYAYFMVICTILFICFIALRRQIKNKFKILKGIFAVLLLGGLLSVVALLPTKKSVISGYIDTEESAWSARKPFEDLFAQSARPLSYFLPAPAHPIFGKFTENFVGTSLYGDSLTEHTLYLGWIPLVFAFIAFSRWKKRGKQSIFENEDFYPAFFFSLALMAWLFSQPPWWEIGWLKIYLPSFFMYKFFPMFRAYCRFGIVVMLAIAVLAGLGLKSILERIRLEKAKIIITIFISSLALFEFWNYPPAKVINVSRVPEIYYWLKAQPGNFVIAEYPLDLDSPNELYKFYQTIHEKKIINGVIPDTPANKSAQKIIRLSDYNTAGALKEKGVRYVLVHHDGYLATGLVEDKEELARIFKNKSLKFIRTFPAQDCPKKEIICTQVTGPIDVYEVK